ncbi:DNA polymerase V [Lachnospiraceae bacterium KH1T2]|nr:DNA polymerase V [Lachnospiraceae bacterium KH1T2]
MSENFFIAIDLKSFYASVECQQRGLNALTTNLVVADPSRTEKTICLAVSPSLKAYGIPGRARLFEALQKVKEVNSIRRFKAPGHNFTGSSSNADELAIHPEFAVDFITAPPNMALYMQISSRIYNIYLKYVAPEDIHVYSIDEVFMDVTHYLKTYNMTPRELAAKMIHDVLTETGITATAGIGTNLYLCKVAMDIVAKHIPADKNGVRIAELNEMTYREKLWDHKPLTDFWRVGAGYARKLIANGMETMGDVARCSIGKPDEYYNEELLYKLFGINAELLIDHAWGWEPCTMADIKAYKPESNSLGSGQVLQSPYPHEKARLIVHEMTDLLALDLVDKRLLTDQIVLTIGYDIENLNDPAKAQKYRGPVITDHYGRKVPKHAHGTANLGQMTSSSELIIKASLELFEKITDPSLLVRRIYVTANHITDENSVKSEPKYEQLDIFTDFAALEKEQKAKEKKRARERKMQEAVLSIRKKFGKNAILKGMNFEEGATTRERNNQIGGHKA